MKKPNLKVRSFVWCEIAIPPELQKIETDDADIQIMEYVNEWLEKHPPTWLKGKKARYNTFLPFNQKEMAKKILSNYWAPPNKDSTWHLKDGIKMSPITDDVWWDDIVEVCSDYDPDDVVYDDDTGNAISEGTIPDIYTYIVTQKSNRDSNDYVQSFVFTWI